MARLSAAERAALPDRAFAYVDSTGARRLPIYDASHVRNALARFDQVHFESDEARAGARRRLLNAAKRFKIVPVGFISNQLEAERRHGAGVARGDDLPAGFVTMLMTDIEGSTALLDDLGDSFGDLLDEVRDVQREATKRAGGHEVEARADEFFAVFESPRCAIDAAIEILRRLGAREGHPVRLRIGVHSGYPTKRADNYVGMAVHTAARVCATAHGGQIIVTDDTRLALTGMIDGDGVGLRRCGRHRLRGIPDDVCLHQITAPGLESSFPPPRT